MEGILIVFLIITKPSNILNYIVKNFSINVSSGAKVII